MIDSLGYIRSTDRPFPPYEFPKSEPREESYCFNPLKKLSQRLANLVICPFMRNGGETDFYTDYEIDPLYSVSLKPITLRKGGVELDALTIIPNAQENLPPERQKWLIFAFPNAMNHDNLDSCDLLVQLARLTGLCVGVTNYRGTRPDTPCMTSISYEDLVEDVDALVEHLTMEEGIRPGNIIMHGLSLGGIVGVEVAARHQIPGEEMHYLGENTLNQFEQVAEELPTSEAVQELLEKPIPILYEKSSYHCVVRICICLDELVFLLPYLALRVALFVFFFFEALCLTEWKCAREALFEIGKSFVLSTLVLTNSVIQLATFPCLDLIDNFNKIDSLYADKFRDGLLGRISQSRTIVALAKAMIRFSEWEADGESAWNKIRGEKLVSQVKKDNVIPFAASLYHAVNPEEEADPQTYLHNSPTSDHCTFLAEENPRLFFDFIERALQVEYAETLKSTPGPEISKFLRRAPPSQEPN